MIWQALCLKSDALSDTEALINMYVVGYAKGASPLVHANAHPLISILPANMELWKRHQQTNTVELAINHGQYM